MHSCKKTLINTTLLRHPMIATIWNICLPAITRSSHSLIICLFKNIAAWRWTKGAGNFMLSLVTYCTMLCSCRAFKGDIQVLSNSEIINSITCTEKNTGENDKKGFMVGLFFLVTEMKHCCCDRDEITKWERCWHHPCCPYIMHFCRRS